MARNKMSKMIVSKGTGNSCALCGMYSKTEEKATKYRDSLVEKYPEKDIPGEWSLRSHFGAEGMCVDHMKYNPDSWSADGSGYTRESSVFICKNCMETLVKCYNAIQTSKSEVSGYTVRETELELLDEFVPEKEETEQF